jgi:hypothetical protein
MKTYLPLILLLSVFLTTSLVAQEPPKKTKEEAKAEKEKQFGEMLSSKEFVFSARMAYPSGGKSRNITSDNYSVKFSPDMIVCHMPFFGTAYSGAPYGGGGFEFEGKPETFTVDQAKKGWDVKVIVKGGNESYTITISTGKSGGGNLTILSNFRSSMSYSGDVLKPEGKN